MGFEWALIFAAVFLLLGVFAGILSDRMGVPALLLFLAIGMLAGSDGIGKFAFDNAALAQQIGMVAFAFIIFSGGFSTRMEEVKPVIGDALVLSTLGVILTAALVGLGAYFFAGFSLQNAMLLGAIVSSTDAAAVFSVLNSRSVRLKGNLKPLLEFESGSNDPMAIFLTMSILNWMSAPDMGLLQLAVFLGKQILVGAAFGIAMAWVATILLKKIIKLEYEGIYAVFTIGVVLVTYALTTILGGSGILAVYLLALRMGNSDFKFKRNVQRFHDNLAWLSQITMFLTLGLLVFPSQLPSVALPGLLVTLVLVFVARPAAVFACLAFSKQWSVRDKLLISWVGLKGATPVILATFPLLAGVEAARPIFNIVFFIVLVSVVIQGTTIVPVSRWLKLEDKKKKNVRYPIEFEKTEQTEGELNEIEIPPESVMVGKKIMELAIPENVLIILIYRNEKFFPATGKTELHSGDRMLVLAKISDFLLFSELVFTPAPPEEAEAPEV